MQKTSRFILGIAVLGAVLLMAADGQARQPSRSNLSKTNNAVTSAPVTAATKKPAPMARSGSVEVDQACVAKHDAEIKKCGKKNKKCVTKHEKLKKKCSSVYHPAERPHMMQQMPQQPAGVVQPYYGDTGQRPMMKMSPPQTEVLERTAPQPTGKSPGVKTPDATYTPPQSWMNWF